MKCKIHGLHFDPEMSTGCTRCMREAAKAQPTRPPQLVLILLCLLGMAFILLYIFGPGRGPATRTTGLGIASLADTAPQRLDPEPFRQPIEALEDALFQTPINQTRDLLVVSADISSSASYLSTRILEIQPADGLTAADLIARMGQAVPDDRVAMADIERARAQWLGIRKQRLQPASWFVQPSDDEASDDATSLSQYSDIASNLRSLLDEGLAEVQTLNDPTTFTDDAGRWRVFTRDWRQQIDSVQNRMPERPSARADTSLLAAIQNLERALSQASALATEPNLPSATDNRFEDAMDLALSAQQTFDELQN